MLLSNWLQEPSCAGQPLFHGNFLHFFFYASGLVQVHVQYAAS